MTKTLTCQNSKFSIVASRQGTNVLDAIQAYYQKHLPTLTNMGYPNMETTHIWEFSQLAMEKKIDNHTLIRSNHSTRCTTYNLLPTISSTMGPLAVGVDA
jgi:alpha-L-fucosidase